MTVLKHLAQEENQTHIQERQLGGFVVNYAGEGQHQPSSCVTQRQSRSPKKRPVALVGEVCLQQPRFFSFESCCGDDKLVVGFLPRTVGAAVMCPSGWFLRSSGFGSAVSVSAGVWRRRDVRRVSISELTGLVPRLCCSHSFFALWALFEFYLFFCTVRCPSALQR